MKAAVGFVQRNQCPVCDSADFHMLLDLAFDCVPISSYLDSFYSGRIDPQELGGGRFVLSKCVQCELVFQRYVPDDEFLGYLYDNSVGDSEIRPGRGLRVRQGYSFQVEQLLKYWDAPPDQVEVLDFGAGGGDWLSMAAAYGCKTFAVELSISTRDALARRGQTVLDPGEFAGRSLPLHQHGAGFRASRRPHGGTAAPCFGASAWRTSTDQRPERNCRRKSSLESRLERREGLASVIERRCSTGTHQLLQPPLARDLGCTGRASSIHLSGSPVSRFVGTRPVHR